MKRFYKNATAEADADGAWRVLLDGKPIKTPAGATLTTPHQALAEAVAAEWAAQGDEIELPAMPMTQLAATMIDRIGPQRETFIEQIAGFAASDLVCYYAAHPASLVAAQIEAWRPLIQWAEERFGAKLTAVTGVMPVDQPEAALAAIRRAAEALCDARLTAAAQVAGLASSAVVALAFALRRLDVDGTWRAALVDELHQMTLWGDDPLAAERRANLRRELEDAARFMDLVGV